MTQPRRELGVTLTELLITMAILVIIVSLAVPNFLEWRTKMEAKRIKNVLFSALRQAKSESFITRDNIILCLSAGEGRCNKNSDKELLLFHDNNNNKHFESLSDQLIVREPLNLKYGDLQLRVSLGHHNIKFFGDTGNPRGHYGHIKYCSHSSDISLRFKISFNQIGIVRHKSVPARDC